MSPSKGYRNLWVVISLLLITCVGHAQAADDNTSGGQPVLEAGGQFYVGRIIGDSVNIRSGPGEIWYPVGQFDNKQQVIVTGEKFGWCQIEPTRQCFSFINADFVKLLDDSVTPKTMGESFGKVLKGEVTGDRVRVRAGSVKVSPLQASEVQMKLDAGTKVDVIGYQDGFFRIIPPKGCSFWVSKAFVRRSGPADAATEAQLRSQAGRAMISDTPLAETTETTTAKTASTETGTVPTSAEESAASGESASSEGESESLRTKLMVLYESYKTENTKPLAQRDFSKIQDELTALLKSSPDSSLKVSMERFHRQVLQAEAILSAWRQSKQQDEQLAMALSEIDSKVQKLAAVESQAVRTKDDLVVKGRLANSAVFSAQLKNRRYLVLDGQDKITYYAVSDRDGLDLGRWVDKLVSMVGWAEYDTFSRIRLLHVKGVVPLPPSDTK